jgi:hypothetical protein
MGFQGFLVHSFHAAALARKSKTGVIAAIFLRAEWKLAFGATAACMLCGQWRTNQTRDFLGDFVKIVRFDRFQRNIRARGPIRDLKR